MLCSVFSQESFLIDLLLWNQRHQYPHLVLDKVIKGRKGYNVCTFMNRRQWKRRWVIIIIKSLITNFLLAYELKSQVYEAGKSNHIVYLECDASYPSEIANLELHPLIVYIQVGRIEVLNKLLRSTCQDKSRRSELLASANRLYDLPCGVFSLILSDSYLDVASRKLELFLESYWISTHPPIPPT